MLTQIPILKGQTIDKKYVDGVIHLKIKDESNLILRSPESTGDGPLTKVFKQYMVYRVERPYLALKTSRFDRWYKVYFSNTAKVDEFIKALSTLKIVELAEKLPIIKSFQAPGLPNDPAVQPGANPSQYSLALIQSYGAFVTHQGTQATRIAIVDDAVQFTHPDLIGNVWTNIAEQNGTPGVDDDNNGYIDDIHGFDVADNDADPLPPSARANSNVFAHGTHCAGIAAASTNNAIGIASSGNSCSFIAVKCTNDNTLNPSAMNSPYEGVTYAIAAGAQVISMSWGTTVPTQLSYEIIARARSLGIILVAAAGNRNDDVFSYPAAYGSASAFTPNPLFPGIPHPMNSLVIAVASSDQNDVRSSFSCYGSWIDIMAPGSSIYSTVPNNDYAFKDGTSMACPLVAGVMGLTRSYSPTSTADQIINCVLSTANNVYQLTGNSNFNGQLGSGRVNSLAALNCLCSPANAVTNLTITDAAGAPLPASYNLGSTFTFRANATLSGTANYQWFINNQLQTSNANQLSLTFTAIGTQTVGVRVGNTNAANCSALLTQTVNVVCPLDVAFTASSTQVLPGASVTFTNTSTDNPAGVIYTWLRDGVPVTLGAGNALLFPTAGRYTITLQAEASFGGNACTNTFSLAINVGMCGVAQPEFSRWHFPNGEELRFNPPAVTPAPAGYSWNIGGMNGVVFNEGNASITDRVSGNTLIASHNGRALNNPSNGAVAQTLFAGFPNLWSSSQSVLLLPHPNQLVNPNVYFAFVSGSTDDGIGVNLFSFTCINGVVSNFQGPRTIVSGRGPECLNATLNCDGTGYWISTLEPDPLQLPVLQTKNIVIFGINQNTPVFPTLTDLNITTYQSGINFTSPNSISHMRFSADGRYLALSSHFNNGLVVYNFNNSTGQITSTFANYSLASATDVTSPLSRPMALEFSPNGRILYVVHPNSSSSRLSQIDLNSPLAVGVNPFIMTIPANAGGIQIAPDMRLYYRGLDYTHIGIIRFPDIIGIGCGNLQQGLAISTAAIYGMPNVVSSSYVQGRALISGVTTICGTGQTLRYTGPRNCANPTYAWSIVSGPGQIVGSATAADVDVRPTGAGSIVLRLSYTTRCGTDVNDVTIRVSAAANQVAITPANPNICLPGAVTLNATSGFASYLWSNSSTASSINPNLAAGSTPVTFSVTATDAAGCTSTASVTVNGQTAGTPVCTLPATIRACENFNGTTLDAGPAASWLWDNSTTSQTRTVFASGTYWATITNVCGNFVTCSTTVTLNRLQLATTVVSPGCGETKGSISATVTGGTPPYSFTLPSAQTSTTGRFNFTSLAPGTYTVSVTDASGCIAEVTATILASAGSSLTVTQEVVPAGCSSSSSTGSVVLNVTGGTPNFSVTGFPNAPVSSSTSQIRVSQLAANTYTMVVTDQNGCKEDVKVEIPNVDFKITATTVAPSCNGARDGAINFNGTSLPAGTVVTYTPLVVQAVVGANTISNLPAGTYTVTATTPERCVRTTTATIQNTLVSCCQASEVNSGYTRFTTTAQQNVTTSRSWGGKIYIPDNVTITVNANVTLDITQADVVFGNCARIVFQNNARVRANNSTFRACNPFASWRGFEFAGNATGVISNCIFKNANWALAFTSVLPEFTSHIRVEDNSFLNCDMGIRSNGTTIAGNITGNTFRIDNMSITWCERARGYTGISLAGATNTGAISLNNFISVNTTERMNGIVRIGGEGGRIVGNTFIDQNLSILVSGTNNVLLEDNSVIISRQLPNSPAASVFWSIYIYESKNVRVFGNSLQNLRPALQERAQTIAIETTKSAAVQLWGNHIRGYHIAINFSDNSESRIVSNTIEYAVRAGIALSNGKGNSVSCNQITLEGTEMQRTTGIRYTDNQPGNNDAQHRITSNCILGADTALSMLDMVQEKESATALPYIANNYLYNYKMVGLYSNGMNGVLGTEQQGEKAGRNTFATSWFKTIDIEFQPNPLTGGQLIGDGNYFTHSSPILINTIMNSLNTSASNAGCGHQLFTDDYTPPAYNNECQPN
ncbi:MAG: S8 family serine peptidase [Bacteroidota bacterium]